MMYVNVPVKRYKIGDLYAGIWAMRVPNGPPQFSIKFGRDNEYAHPITFSETELLVVAKLAERCEAWISAQLDEDL